jgi:hypothetical protein
MALAKLLPRLRLMDQSLAEMQFWLDCTTRKRRNAACAVANNNGLLVTIEKLSLEPTPETTGDEKLPHGPEQAGRMDSNWERVNCVTAQAYVPRVTKFIPITRGVYVGGNPQGQKHEICTPRRRVWEVGGE